MTKVGYEFARIAQDVVNHYKGGFGSKKMVIGYTIYERDGEPNSKESAELLEQLVQMGYLRKFVGNTHLNNTKRNWRYRFWVKDVYFGLTDKGWEVAPQYLKAIEQIDKQSVWDSKAKAYCEKVKATNPISYEEAYALAKQGVL